MIPKTATYRVTYRDGHGVALKTFNVLAPTKFLAKLAVREAWLGEPLETYQRVICAAMRVTYYRCPNRGLR